MEVDSGAPIESLRNLGPKSGQWLRDAGITTIAELERLGPVVVYRLVKQRQPKTSLHLLWALAAGLKAVVFRVCGLRRFGRSSFSVQGTPHVTNWPTGHHWRT